MTRRHYDSIGESPRQQNPPQNSSPPSRYGRRLPHPGLSWSTGTSEAKYILCDTIYYRSRDVARASSMTLRMSIHRLRRPSRRRSSTPRWWRTCLSRLEQRRRESALVLSAVDLASNGVGAWLCGKIYRIRGCAGSATAVSWSAAVEVGSAAAVSSSTTPVPRSAAAVPSSAKLEPWSAAAEPPSAEAVPWSAAAKPRRSGTVGAAADVAAGAGDPTDGFQ